MSALGERLTWAGAWAVLVSFLLQVGGWSYVQLEHISGRTPASYVEPLLALVQAGLIAAIGALARRRETDPNRRAVGQLWLLACAALPVLALARAVPITAPQLATAVQAGLCLLLAAALHLYAARQGSRSRNRDSGIAGDGSHPVPRPPTLIALALVPLYAGPWLLFGAAGSPLDLALNLLTALGAGWLTAGAFGLTLVPALLGGWPGRGRGLSEVFAGGVALLLFASSLGFGGSQLLLMASLPPVALVLPMLVRASAVRVTGHGSRVTGEGVRLGFPVTGDLSPVTLVLVAGVVAPPLALVDPAELVIVLGFEDVPGLAFNAAFEAAVAGLVLGVVLRWLVGSFDRLPLAVAVAGLVLTWGLAGATFLGSGRAGWHGDWLFVILRDQADVRSAAAIPDRTERLRTVYATLTRHADTTQAGLRALFAGAGLAYRPYYLVNAIEVDGGPLVQAMLAGRPEVDRVLPSPRLRPLPGGVPVTRGEPTPPRELPWNITSIGADRVWRELGVTGRGIVVGQSDSGVDGGHPALRDGYRGRAGGDAYNWYDPWSGTRAPTDHSGHGTHTLGTVLGRGGIGVAPDAEWIGCVNLERNLGNPALYLDCLQFMLAPFPPGGDPWRDGDPARAAHVLNNSWGCPDLEGCDAGSLGPAVAALRAAGIFVVASAGNDGPDCGSLNAPPAIYADALTVGAVNRIGNLASFSSRGPVEVDGSGRAKPDLVAPGADVLSAMPGGTYASLDGTSMAGPHAAGVVALMWSANPALVGQIDRTEQLLLGAVKPYAGAPAGWLTPDGRNAAAGRGLLDAHAAVQAALAAR